MDIVDTKTRSRMMGRIRARDTTPERRVRSFLHACGLRYSLHRRDLPGSPDIVLPAFKTVVFVHGCFWHRHPGCQLATTPATRPAFWKAKFDSNVTRDARNEAQLASAGWQVLTIWECETDPDSLERLFWQIVAGQP